MDLICALNSFQDIVWPGDALKPPEGLPEKRFIRVSFLEEDPYVMLGPPSTCASSKGVICYMVDPAAIDEKLNLTEEATKVRKEEIEGGTKRKRASKEV